MIAFRPEASLIYVNADAVLESVLNRLGAAPSSDIRLVVCDLSASPYLDLAGSRMLHELHGELTARGIALRIVGAHGWARDLLRADGVGEKIGGLDRAASSRVICSAGPAGLSLRCMSSLLRRFSDVAPGEVQERGMKI